MSRGQKVKLSKVDDDQIERREKTLLNLIMLAAKRKLMRRNSSPEIKLLDDENLDHNLK